MAITGAHVLLYTSNPDGLRATLRDVFGWTHVDAGQGWLIFALPPAEVGVHPADGTGPHHELSLMCDDITRTIAGLRAKGVVVNGQPQDRGWGIVVTLALPGGLDVLLYQPRHPVAIGTGTARQAKKAQPARKPRKPRKAPVRKRAARARAGR